MKRLLNKRALVSFSGYCPLRCKHCYTYELKQEKNKKDYEEINEIIDSLYNKEFDVVYVSHDRENMIDEKAGVELVKRIYKTFHKPILIITRKVLGGDTITSLSQICESMKANNNIFAVGVSVSANDSYNMLEDISVIDSPEDRFCFIQDLHNNHIPTILMARPILPDNLIPTREIIDLIKKYSPFIDAIVSSGVAVNDGILKRLGMSDSDFNYLPGDNAEFLIGTEVCDIKYVDVKSELERVKECCDECDKPFFTHSMDALNFLERIGVTV